VSSTPPVAQRLRPELRERMRHGVDVVALAGGGLATVIQTATLAKGVTTPGLAACLLTATIAVCGLLGLGGRARWTPIAYVVLLSLANLIASVLLGLRLGMGTIYILVIALAFLLLSRIWRWVTVGSVLLTPVIVGALFEYGVLERIPVLQPHEGAAWWRILLVGTLAMLCTAAMIGFAVRHLIAGRREIEIALHNEREARRAREQVEIEIARAQRSDLIVELAAEVGANIGAALAVISSRAEALTRELDDEARICLADVLAASSAARSTMRSLTVFAAEAPGGDARCDAALTARTLPQMVRRVLPERIALELATEAGAWVPLSATDLVRILSNLVLNARDAITDAGSIGVHVRRGGGDVTIEVTDDGSGMDEETRSRLFQPFFTTKPIGRGTGLGLATAKILVERAGGELTFVSEHGRGTQFTIRLPEVAAPSGASADDASTERGPHAPIECHLAG